jgi:methylated-DNA-[protein]-cysteine S-methyltransferase
MSRTHAVIGSPLGPLTAVADGSELIGLYLADQQHLPDRRLFGVAGPPLPGLSDQLAEYFAGTRRAFELPLRPAGTPFQQRVWSALREVPYGATTTYGELAAAVGAPSAARAVGAANVRNPLCVVVPCHRVIGRDGSLTGYAGGLARKRLLLELEAG